MELIEHATAACKECNIPPLITPIRGGTDGAQLSFMGLPCPNLGTGGHAYHGPYEHITVEGMDIAVDVGLVVGITAATTPIGSAILVIPNALSSSITPQVLVSR